MTADQNIFSGGDTNTTAPVATSSPSDSFADLLGSIKNERGEPKYKDVQTALDALKHSQDFIPQLKTEADAAKREADALRAEVERLKVAQDTLDRLTAERSNQPNNQQVNTLGADEVENLVQKALTQREQLQIKKQNTASVVSELQKSFGDEAEKVFYSKAQELGMDAAQINSLAASSPAAVLQLFGLKNSTQIQHVNPSVQTSVNTAGFKPHEQTYVTRNSKTALVGATTSDLRAERENSKKLVEELHNKGLTTYDLTDPKEYFKVFGNSN